MYDICLLPNVLTKRGKSKERMRGKVEMTKDETTTKIEQENNNNNNNNMNGVDIYTTPFEAPCI